MKATIKILILLLAAALMLTGCGGGETAPETTQSKEATYQVTVTDALGSPYTSGVIVCFLQDGQQVAMQAVDANGVAAKTLTRGEYTAELVFTGDESAYHYEKEGLSLSAEVTELTVILTEAVQDAGTELYAQGQAHTAYAVGDGGTYLTLTDGIRNYFLYTPTVAGTFEFALAGENVTIGYYGAPHFVQSESAAEVRENAFTLSIRADMIGAGGTGTAVVVIGVDAAGATEAVLTVQRIGDPAWNVADEPWTIYQTTAQLADYTLPAGAKLENFNIKAASDAYTLVFNEAEGFYHLDSADGPLVLVWLGEGTQYLDSFEEMLEHSGVSKYFYDENGEFLKKESYSECLLEYIGHMDENKGVYPLTEDLKYIIQQRGDHYGWFDPESPGYLFVNTDFEALPGINNEISWLFMCCYIPQE